MTRRTRQKSRSPEFSTKSQPSNTSRHKHHRKTPKENVHIDELVETSGSNSPQIESEEYEDDEQAISLEGSNSSAYMGSETITKLNAPTNHHLPLPVPQSLPTHKITSNTFDHAIPSLKNSASNSPNELQPIIPFASYINIAPLPVFNGTPDECPVTHLSRFAKVCRANNVSSIEMMVRIFPVTLDKEAALWYDLNIEPYPWLIWEEIKSSFLQAYRRNDFIGQFRSELMMLNQGREEPVRSYFLRLQWIIKRWPDHGIPETLLKGIFIDGLREDFQDWIIPQKPDSLDDALGLAFTWEQVRSIRMARKREVKCGFCDGGHEEQGCDIRERMRQLWLKNKEKQSTVCLGEIESDGAGAEEVARSVSLGTSSIVGRHEEEDGKKVLGGKKRSQRQCWKHQCRKKKLERNNSTSLLTGNSINADQTGICYHEKIEPILFIEIFKPN